MSIAPRLVGLLSAAGVLVGCGAGPADPPAPTTSTATRQPTDAGSVLEPEPRPSRTPNQPVVVLISVDGLNPEVLDETDLPAFARLADEGASTLNARTIVEATETLPNHAAMLTGRPLAGFSVAFNDDNGGTLAREHGEYVPGIFDVAHDRDVATALLAEKEKFHFLVRSWDAEHGAPDRVGADNGTDKTDIDLVAPVDRLLPRGLDALAGGVRLVFLHLQGPDGAGHQHGWLGERYAEAVQVADGHIGAILDAVETDSDLRRRTTVIVTADHGGSPGEREHHDSGEVHDYRVPFFVWGRAVRSGADLYELNRDRRADPGTGQPSYDGRQPIRNLDAANLALRLLGLPGLEDGLDTRPLRLR